MSINTSQNDCVSELLEALWNEFQEGLDSVFEMRNISRKKYMDLYTMVYQYFTHVVQQTPGLTNSPSFFTTSGTASTSSSVRHSKKAVRNTGAGTNSISVVSECCHIELNRQAIHGENIYIKIKDYVKNVVNLKRQNVSKLSGVEILEYYKKNWNRFVFSTRVLNNVCKYLNDHFIARMQAQGKRQFQQINNLCYIIWKENFLKPSVTASIEKAILDIIRADRKKEFVVENAMSYVTIISESFTVLSLSDVVRGEQATYEVYFHPVGELLYNPLAEGADPITASPYVPAHVTEEQACIVLNNSQDGPFWRGRLYHDFVVLTYAKIRRFYVDTIREWSYKESGCDLYGPKCEFFEIDASKRSTTNCPEHHFNLTEEEILSNNVIVSRNTLYIPGRSNVTQILSLSQNQHQPTTHPSNPHGVITTTVAATVNPGSGVPLPPQSTSVNIDMPLTPKVYLDFFEVAYLRETINHYICESDKFIANNSIAEYLKMVENSLDQEIIRITRCNLNDSYFKIMMSCILALIVRHQTLIIDEFENLLNNEKVVDLKRMYRLLSLTKYGVSKLVQRMEKFVCTKGRDAIEEASSLAIQDAKLYVDTLLSVYTKCRHFVDAAFDSNSDFLMALDKGCKAYVNINAVTAVANDNRKSPELLARYCDSLMRKVDKDMTVSVEERIVQVMIAFKYLDDRDVFQKFYSKFLCRRLVGGSSTSDELETTMITRLKETCGVDYTNKLMKMITDKATSRDMVGRFLDYVRRKDLGGGSLPISDFHFMVLSSNSWPLNAVEPLINLPQEMRHCQESFHNFYSEEHNGRKLSWCWTVGRGEMTTSCFNSTHVLVVSPFQMIVLSLFNDVPNITDTISAGSIERTTNIPWNFLSQTLAILVKHHILKIDDSNPTNSAEEYQTNMDTSTPGEVVVTPSTLFYINKDFKSKRVKINLNVPLKTEVKQETEQTFLNVESDRRMILEATLVRVMKMRREIYHNQLISEVITQVESRFKPSVTSIKRCIDGLIDREYMMRGEHERDLYHYVA